jgi:uncharacterized membrane protein
MRLKEFKIIFIAIGLIGVLLIASPTIALAIPPLPSGEQFSELFLLGPNQMAENYPSNIAAGKDYTLYVNVVNHLDSSAYYIMYVKLGNRTDQLPNATLATPSPLPPLLEYRFSIQQNETWQNQLNFSVTKATITSTTSQINTLKINNESFNVDKSAAWNSNSSSFNYRLFFELWLYNQKTGSTEYNNRFVSLQLNLTQSSQ